MSRQQSVVLERVSRMHALLGMLRKAESEAADRERLERARARPPKTV